MKWLVWLAVGVGGCGLAHRDPVIRDPATIDTTNPPTMRTVAIPSGGVRLLGNALLANGAGPHPTLVMLHGFPGNENNYDLAHAARRAGWNALVFHYRGSWGSPGDFSFTHVLQDVEAALRFLRRPAAARDLRVDTRQLVLAGHSMGGFAALYVGARHPELRGVASLAGFDFGAAAAAASDDGARVWVDRFREALPPLAGTTAEALVQEFLARGDAWALSRSAPAYAERTVLLVAAEHDGVAPPDLHHTPLVAAFEAAGARLDVGRLPGDHGFSARRVTLARTLVDWLETLVQSAAVSETPRPPVGVSATTPSADWASR